MKASPFSHKTTGKSLKVIMRDHSEQSVPDPTLGESGCLPFVRINRLGRALGNGKGFSKISKPTEQNGAYHLQFDSA